MAINEKQKKLAYEYVMHSKTKVDAYKTAYEPPSGLTTKQLADRADRAFISKAVQAEIERLRQDNAEAEIITRDDLLLGVNELIEKAQRCMVKVIYNEDGEEEEILIPKYADIYLKAVDRAAKMIGADAPQKVENDVNVHIGDGAVKYGS